MTETRLEAPAVVRSIDLDEPLEDLVVPPSRLGGAYRSAAVVVHMRGAPLGMVVVGVEEGRRVAAAAIEAAVASQLCARAGAAPRPPAEAGASSAPAPPVSVVVTTAGRPERLVRCVDSVLRCRHEIEVIAVENRPRGSRTRQVLAEQFAGEPRLRYVEEPRQGLSWARNAGLGRAAAEIVAFTDDDVVVDRSWVSTIAATFAACPEAACVTGLILPLELETAAQVLMEQFASFGKGYRRRTHRREGRLPSDPLFPFAAGAVGSGANTAMRVEVARDSGAFDPALGAGTPARGGEDLDLYIRLLLAGHVVVYEPRAMVWHEHPAEEAELRRRALDYGIGLSAMLAKHALIGAERRELLHRAPAGVRHVMSRSSRKNAQKRAGYAARLDWLERAGMLLGPAAYIRSRSQSAAQPRKAVG